MKGWPLLSSDACAASRTAAIAGPMMLAAESKSMKLCYCDESGTGDEPIATMAGILVDAQRMHLTKTEWKELLEALSKIARKRITELHTRDFYPGNGVWHGLTGPQRAGIVTRIFEWIGERKHHLVFSSMTKARYFETKDAGHLPSELNTVWRFLGFHLVLAVQRYCQTMSHNKGHTLFVFDNEYREHTRFPDLLVRPQDWSDEYYNRKAKQESLDQVVDVPYFGDSREVSLIQVADFVSFFLRRYAEVCEGLGKAPYADEKERLGKWIKLLAGRCIGTQHIYPKIGRNAAQELFYAHAPASIREL